MRLLILRIGIVDIVRRHKRYIQLLAQAQQRRVDCALRGNPMILQLEKIVALAKTIFVFERSLFCLLIQPFCEQSWHLARKACGECNNSLMELFKDFHVHTRLIIISFRKSLAHNFHQIGVALVILCQQHQMMIALLPAADFLVKTRIGRDINLTPENRLDAVCLRFFIEVNNAVHHAMVCDCRTVHAKLFDALDIFFNLVGAVKQTVLRMHMQMCKCHCFLLFSDVFYSILQRHHQCSRANQDTPNQRFEAHLLMQKDKSKHQCDDDTQLINRHDLRNFAKL